MLAGKNVRLQLGERVFRAANHRKVVELLEMRVVRHIFHIGAQRELGVVLGAGVELIGREEQRFGRQHRALGIALHEAKALLGVLPEAQKRGFEIAVQHDGRVGAKVVEHRRRVVEEQRQVVLDAGGRHAIAHVLVDAALGRIALQQLAPAVAELGARIVVHRELAAGQQAHFGHGVEAALRVGIEGADRVNLVVEQVHAIRHVRAHREQVDQPAAHGVFAMAHHLRDVGVARQRELRAQLGFVELLLGLEVEGVAREERGRSHAVERRRRGHQHHVDLALRDAPERGQALADQVLMRRKRVVGQGFPIGKHGAAQLGREECHLVDQAARVRRIGGDDGHHMLLRLLALGQAREQQRVGRPRRARHRKTFSGREFGQIHGNAADSGKAETTKTP